MIISRVKEATSQFIKVMRYGKSDVVTADQYLPFGIDSKPTKNKLALFCKTADKSEPVVIGYISNSSLTNEGEMRIYSSDSDGNEKTYVHLKANGNIEIGGNTDNLVRFSELEKAFDELKEDFNSFISQTYNLHTHPGVLSGGASTAVTASLGTETQADISGAKIDEIKTI